MLFVKTSVTPEGVVGWIRDAAVRINGLISGKQHLDAALTANANGTLTINVPGNYANDAAAATGGVAVGGIYRNGSVLMVRVT